MSYLSLMSLDRVTVITSTCPILISMAKAPAKWSEQCIMLGKMPVGSLYGYLYSWLRSKWRKEICKLCSVRNCMSDLIVNLWKTSGIYIHESRLSLWLISTVYEVYEGSADAAFQAASLCLSMVPVVGYKIRLPMLSLSMLQWSNLSAIPPERIAWTKLHTYNKHHICLENHHTTIRNSNHISNNPLLLRL